MAVTNYYTVNGKIRGEGTAAGGFRPYGHDALGSVVATYDSTGSLENTYRNAPYGTQVAKTGTAADPRFLYNGGSGYRTTGRSYSPYYVRARHLDNKSAQWITVDSLWPSQAPYGYVRGRPAQAVDPSGNAACMLAENFWKCEQRLINQLYTPFEACIACNEARGHPLSVAIQVCSRIKDSLPRPVGPPRPGPVPVLKGTRTPWVSPPQWVDVLLTAVGAGVGPEASGLISAPGAALCASVQTKLRQLWQNFCAEDEDAPGRAKYPSAPPQFWTNYCAYLDWARSDWSHYCQDI